MQSMPWMNKTWVPGKIRDFGFWVGGNGRETGVYMPIHEDFEAISNAARNQKIDF
jgi:hypothetical protein